MFTHRNLWYFAKHQPQLIQSQQSESHLPIQWKPSLSMLRLHPPESIQCSYISRLHALLGGSEVSRPLGRGTIPCSGSIVQNHHNLNHTPNYKTNWSKLSLRINAQVDGCNKVSRRPLLGWGSIKGSPPRLLLPILVPSCAKQEASSPVTVPPYAVS